MTMAKPESTNPDRQQVSQQKLSYETVSAHDIDQDASRLLQQRLELVEDLWQTVLKSECPPEQLSLIHI